jgi:hypothetical protein
LVCCRHTGQVCFEHTKEPVVTHVPGTSSPFRFEGPLEPDDLIGRHAEIATLLDYAAGGRAVSLAAPRRYGKTSLLRAVGARFAREQGAVVARVDLLGLADAADFATRFATAWRSAAADDRRLRSAVERVVSGLSSLGVSLAGVGVQVSMRRTEDVIAVVHTLLDLPGQVSRPVLLVLDEFQALHAAWPNGEGVLRGHVQEQLGGVSYVFAGSQPHLLEAAFANRGRAFYQQVLRVPLGRLADSELAEGLTDRFEATDRDPGPALPALLRLAGGHPQRAMFLAHLLWEQVAAGQRADEDAADRVVARARAWVADEMVAIWSALTPAQQAALREVHRHGSAALRRHTAGTTSRATLVKAQQHLLREGLVELSPEMGPRQGRRYRLVDPLLGDWIAPAGG